MPIQEPDAVELGDKSVETSNFDRYKGRKNVTDRLAILSPRLLRGYRYYYEPKKRSFIAPKTPEILAKVKKEIGEPVQVFALVIFQYTTDENGALLDENKLGGKVKLWRWSEAKYEEFSALSKNWPIMNNGFEGKQHDFTSKCTEEQYQRMTTQPLPDSHWKKKQAWYDALMAKEAKAEEKLPLLIGSKLTDQEILDLLGSSSAGVAAGSTDNAGDVDLSDVLDDDIET